MKPVFSNRKVRSRRILIQAVPIVVFATLLWITFLVVGQQVENNRRIVARHAQDICKQAARRLQARFDSRIRVASLFARRWATHESRDFSRKRFHEFASVLLAEMSTFHAFRLLNTDKNTEWKVALLDTPMSDVYFDKNRKSILSEIRQNSKPYLSAPYKCEGIRSCVFANLPLRREQENLGILIVEFDADDLIKEVFHPQIHSEFNIQVQDGDYALYVGQSDKIEAVTRSTMGYSVRFRILNRTWKMSIMPGNKQLESTRWLAQTALLSLGVILSVGFSALVYLLLKRMRLYQITNQKLLEEIRKKEEAQFALGTTEARYKSVFNSATDGLLVIDQNDIIVEANEAANALHGYPSGGLTDRNYSDLIALEYKHLYDEFRRQLDRSGTVRLDSVHVTRTGRTFDVEVRGTNFHFGNEPRVLAIVTDVSELRRAMQRQTMLSRKVLMAQEDERSRVSRDLHDELGQILTALHLELDILQKDLGDIPEPASKTYANALTMIEKAADELRHVCRGLRPPMLDDLGIEPALRSLISEYQERTNLKTQFIFRVKDEGVSVPLEVALCIYRIVQESFNNISRHANATEVEISLIDQNGEWVLNVSDNGVGFDMNIVNQSKGCGIAGMRERALLVNGSLEIHSVPSGGTRLQLRVSRPEPVKE